ncbi:MAG: transporter [Roseburia sp.]|uniref:hypothetical protein n=1 Tax=Roseburia sp. 831b TaxID=1261635 RepID=UPI00095298C2|nr:hypothetical protein [Roseburia sp. 831b]MCI5920306.1 transporter [Roseburia sp.]MDD6217336.1 transporter [Roseburia sp.]MDY5884570.1 transporter [Roseburia sp.]WVK72312.1 transporter [Roseburia sp. 831b]
MEKKTDFKALSGKAKAQYIFDYYKWPILIGIVVLIILIKVIIHFVTYKEPVLNVTMVNCYQTAENTDTSSFDDFFEKEGFDAAKECIGFTNSLTWNPKSNDSMSVSSYESIALHITAGDEDVFFAPPDVFEALAPDGCMLDLRTLFSDEELDSYSDFLVYTTDSETQETYPCGFALKNNPWITEHEYYDDTCYLGILYTSKHKDTALDFVDYIINP